MQRRFKSTRGGIDVDLTDDEKVFLTGLLDLLAGIPAAADEPASRRLRVPVYLDDPESNEEWWRLMEGELHAARNADRRVFQHILDEEGRQHMSNEEADAFLRVLNEGRLALGARFGLEVEEDHDQLPEEQRDIMDYLGWLLEDLTSELSRSL
ncbi:MAG TPA: DUF2017 family protein [Acidimicrobiia bacterium]|jgi:Domain of unknown function (DUF2017)|nr:DUF2017 family protein [Acidimicrobiia bacterium]